MSMEKTDGRGILSGGYLNQDRPLTRQDWLEECFPEWGTYLNQEIERTQVEPDSLALWWLGGPSWAGKSPGGVRFLLDNYAGPSLYTSYEYCGVCRTGGAPSIDWMRLNPQLIDIWKMNGLDALFVTHHHQDHCDIYTVKALLQTTNCKFVGPLVTVQERFRKWGVPEDRILLVKPGDVVKIRDLEVEVVMNYDRIATMTGTQQGQRRPFEEVAVCYLFKTPSGNILFMGDTLYENAYAAVGKKYRIDVAVFDMGHNAPGATDKMTPWDAFRVGQALGARILIPDHYDNWANCQENPEYLDWIVKHEAPDRMKTVILQWGAKWVYPKDESIGRYRYPDWAERYRPDYSWEYGDLRES